MRLFGYAIVLLLALSWSTNADAKKNLRVVDNLVNHFLSSRDLQNPESPSIVRTENFAIHYLPHQFSDVSRVNHFFGSQWIGGENVPGYIMKVWEELELAHLRTKELGYPEPSYGKKDLISVFIVSPDKFDEGVLAQVSHHFLSVVFEDWPRGSYMTLPNNLHTGNLRGSVAHEVFHLFQDIPRFKISNKLSWLFESTATWAEDELFPPKSGIGYPKKLHKGWWREWGTLETPFVGLDDQRDDRNNAVWYPGAVLFKWWTENLSGGRDIVREILGPGLRLDNAKHHLVQVLGKYAPPYKTFPDLFLDASLASYLLTGPAPYALRRGDEVEKRQPRDTSSGPFSHESYEGLTGELMPETVKIPSFAAYFQRIPAEKMDRPEKPKPLFISIAPKNLLSTRLALVETALRLPGKRRVTVLEPGSYVIPRFADDYNETIAVDLVAVNGALTGIAKLDWAFSVGGPPILEKAIVEASGKRIYEAVWKQESLPDKVISAGPYTALRPNLEEVLNALPPELEGKETLSSLEVRLTFSQPVHLREVRLGETVLKPTEQDGLRIDWELRADRVPINNKEGGGSDLTLAVNAWNGDAMRLDGDPETPAVLNETGTGWTGYEGFEDIGYGGEDRNHVLDPSREDHLVPPLKIAGRVIIPKEYRPNGDGKDIPIKDARIFGFAAYYTVPKKLAERFITLTKQMAPMADHNNTRTAEDDERWADLYAAFEPVVKKAEAEAKFSAGHSKDWRTTTNSNGEFDLSNMPSPGTGGIIAACYGFWAYADDHGSAIDGRTFTVFTVDYFGYDSYPKMNLRRPISDFRINLSHQDRLPWYKDLIGQPLSRFEVGGTFTGTTLSPPLRPGWKTTTYLIKPRIDGKWVNPVKLKSNKTVINSDAVTVYNQCKKSGSSDCFKRADGIGFGIKRSNPSVGVKMTSDIELGRALSEYQMIHHFTRVPTHAGINHASDDGYDRSGPEHRRQLAVGSVGGGMVRQNWPDFRCKPERRKDVFLNIRLYYAPWKKKRSIVGKFGLPPGSGKKPPPVMKPHTYGLPPSAQFDEPKFPKFTPPVIPQAVPEIQSLPPVPAPMDAGQEWPPLPKLEWPSQPK